MSTAAKKRAKTSKRKEIDLTTMEIPTGKFKGALPDNILINGERWICIKTGDVKGRTYDKIENTVSKERKVFERQVLLEFLRKNWKKTFKNVLSIQTTVVPCDNIEAQKSVIFPSVNF